MKRSKFAKFRDDIINIDGVMTSLIIRHDVKIWWRHISVKNVGIALKLCRLFDLVVAIICTNFCEFSQSRSWFTEIPSFTDVAYLWRHWRLPTAYYKRHGLKNGIFGKNVWCFSIWFTKVTSFDGFRCWVGFVCPVCTNCCELSRLQICLSQTVQFLALTKCCKG